MNDYALRAFNEIEKFLTPVEDYNATSARMKKGEFTFIPLPLSEFIAQMEVVSGFFPYEQWGRLGKNPLFVDVGCGIGTKLLIAKQFGRFDLAGIEIYPDYLKVARELVSHAKFIEGNALKQDYSPYDVIYFYCPSSNKDIQQKLEARIIKTAKPGAYVLANLKMGDDIWVNGPMKRVWESGMCRGVIYQKVK